MSRPGLRSRAILHASAAVVFVGVTFCAVVLTMPVATAVEKIGPGYARMQPIDYGKAEKAAHFASYSIPSKSRARTAKPSIQVLPEPARALSPPPLVIAAVQPFSNVYTHRVY